MDIIPTLIDGAVVCSLQNECSEKDRWCEKCMDLSVMLHNWVKVTNLSYLIFDFSDEKLVCPAFLEGLVLMRKRLRFPCLFAGALEQTRQFLESHNYGQSYPLFVVPEDAIRALRMQHPGLTETMPTIPIMFDFPLSKVFRTFSEEAINPEIGRAHV